MNTFQPKGCNINDLRRSPNFYEVDLRAGVDFSWAIFALWLYCSIILQFFVPFEKTTVGARIPNIRIPNPFENRTFLCSDFEWFSFRMVRSSTIDIFAKLFVPRKQSLYLTVSSHLQISHKHSFWTCSFSLEIKLFFWSCLINKVRRC